MIYRLRQSFAKLTPEDISLLWREYLHDRGQPFTPPSVKDGVAFFDMLASGGVSHSDLAAPLLRRPEYRRLLAIVTGQEI